MGNESLEPAACGEAGVHRSSGVGGTGRAGSPASVHKRKHSYANGSRSLGSVRVGERRAEILHCSRFPSLGAGRGERMCRSAAPVLRVSFLSVLSLIFPPSFRCVSVFASHAWQQSSVLWGASRVSPGENRLRKFRVLADSRVATCSGAECETCFGFRSWRGMAL